MHAGLAPDEPDAPRDFVAIDRDGVPRKVLHGGAMGDIVEPDPSAPAPAFELDPNRFVFICKCGVASRGRPVGDHVCAPPPDPWAVADRRRRLGLARQVDPARKPEPAAAPVPAPNDGQAPSGPPEKSLRRTQVRSTSTTPPAPKGEPERTAEPESWLS